MKSVKESMPATYMGSNSDNQNAVVLENNVGGVKVNEIIALEDLGYEFDYCGMQKHWDESPTSEVNIFKARAFLSEICQTGDCRNIIADKDTASQIANLLIMVGAQKNLPAKDKVILQRAQEVLLMSDLELRFEKLKVSVRKIFKSGIRVKMGSNDVRI